MVYFFNHRTFVVMKASFENLCVENAYGILDLIFLKLERFYLIIRIYLDLVCFTNLGGVGFFSFPVFILMYNILRMRTFF